MLFVPSERNPLKLDAQISPTGHRVAMTQLAIDGDPRFERSDADVGGDGPSFTVDLLERLHRDLGGETELAFICGMDVLHELHRWREPLRLLKLARLIAIARPGVEQATAESVEARVPGASARITVVVLPVPGPPDITASGRVSTSAAASFCQSTSSRSGNQRVRYRMMPGKNPASAAPRRNRSAKKLHGPRTSIMADETTPHEIMIRAIQMRTPTRSRIRLLGTSNST